jgi:flagellar biosynthesis/type III secretory pathway M-ring protein FliF/YscJ
MWGLAASVALILLGVLGSWIRRAYGRFSDRRALAREAEAEQQQRASTLAHQLEENARAALQGQHAWDAKLSKEKLEWLKERMRRTTVGPARRF